jgi:hypothetical protein
MSADKLFSVVRHDKNGQTALMNASEYSCFTAVNSKLNHGTSINKKNNVSAVIGHSLNNRLEV